MLEKILAVYKNDLSTLYVDMDSFFASIAQADRPELRGRPVGVCPCLHDSCAVVAASYEAKRAGVSVGMRIAQARQLVPDMEFVCDSPASYRKIHRLVVEVLNNTPCQVGVKGIDEAFLKLPSYMVGRVDEIEKLIEFIKSHFGEVLGPYITASIGVAANIWLAKMAASSCKPNGARLLSLPQLPSFYDELRLTDFTGISWRMARRIYAFGIYTPKALYKASYSFLQDKMGVNGGKWWLRMHGYEVDILRPKDRQSISHQTTLMPKPAQNVSELNAALAKIVAKLAFRLRKNDQKTRSVLVWLKKTDKTYQLTNIKLTQATNAAQDILPQVKQAFNRTGGEVFTPVKKLAVVALDLSQAVQLQLFGDSDCRTERLSEALDRLYDRWGRDIIMPASSLNSKIVPDRIGFGQSETETPFS